MGDPFGLVIREQTEEVESRLEVCMLEEEPPEVDEMVWWASSIESLSDESKPHWQVWWNTYQKHTTKPHKQPKTWQIYPKHAARAN